MREKSKQNTNGECRRGKRRGKRAGDADASSFAEKRTLAPRISIHPAPVFPPRWRTVACMRAVNHVFIFRRVREELGCASTCSRGDR